MASNDISRDEDAPGYLESEIRDSPFEYNSDSGSDSSSSESDSSDEWTEASSSAGENEDDADGDGGNDAMGAEPYRFEPVLPPGVEQRRPPVGDDQYRLQTVDWCQCNNCIRMPTVTESICCREVDQVAAKVDEVDGLNCLIDHEAFWRVAQDPIILDIAFIGYNKRDVRRMNNGNINQRYRYTAYRQVVRWCWGILGRKNRVPIPSCVVKKIVDTFSLPDGQVKRGFLYPPL